MPDLDIDHASWRFGDSEDHPGWTPSKIAKFLPAALRSTQPRVVLLHAGTNELDLSGMTSILDIIQQYDPATVVVLARIINNQTYDPAITSFNAELTGLAAARIARGRGGHRPPHLALGN